MSDLSDEIKTLKTAFVETLKDIMDSKDKRISELAEENGRLKTLLEISNEKMTRLLKGEN